MNSNLINLLSRLEISELKTVVRFAKSPFHNSNKLIIELLKELLVYHPHFKHKRLTQEIIFRKIHSEGTAYDNGKMNLLMTQLVKLTERFIMYQEFEKDNFLQKKMKGQGFWKRNFERKYKKEAEKNLKEINVQSYYDEDYFLNKYSIYQESFFRTISKSNHDEQSLILAIKNLDQFYIAAKLKLSIDQVTRKLSYSNQENEIISNELLTKIKSTYKDNPLVNVYSNIILLRTTNQYLEELYNETKKLFEENLQKFKFETKRLIYLNLLNYNIQGNLTNHSKNTELYKIGIDNNLITFNDVITPISYINIASHAIIEKKYDWSMKIILEYENFLPPKEAKDTKLAVLAFWHLCKGNEHPKNYDSFDKVLELMSKSKISKKDSRMTFRNKSIIIRAYYELISINPSYEGILTTELFNFENQLKKDKIISGILTSAYLDFIQFTRQLLKIKLKPKKNFQEIQKIQNSFSQSNSTFAAKFWVEEKIEEFLTTPQSNN